MIKQFYFRMTCVITISVAIMGCVGNIAPETRSSDEAEKDGLLIAKYAYPQSAVLLDDEEYIITDAWCSYRFASRNSTQINTGMYQFYVQMKHRKSGEFITSPSIGPEPREKIEYLGKEYGYTNGIGLSPPGLSKDFITKNKPVPPDTITFKFNNTRQDDVIINFIKQ